MTGDQAGGQTFQALYAEEARRAKYLTYRIRWVFLAMVAGMSLVMLVMDRYRVIAYASGAFLLGAVVYNHLLGRALHRGPVPAWLRYLPITMDIVLITTYNYMLSVFITPLGASTTATIFVYFIILLYSALILDKWLLVYALTLTLVCFNLPYFLRYPYLDQALVRQVVSSDITGHIFKSLFILAFGVSLLYVHQIVRRLITRQALAYQDKLAAEERHLATLETQVRQRTQELSQANQELRQALSEVNTLSGLLPICSHCKKIRDDSGYWQQVEQYLAEHTQAVFSHGLCPDCLVKYYPEFSGEVLQPAPAPPPPPDPEKGRPK